MIDSKKLNELAQQAFEKFDFGDVEIVDKLRDVTTDEENDEIVHLIGHCFGQAPDDKESMKISFHVLINITADEPSIETAYAYDCPSGNDLGRWPGGKEVNQA